MERKGVEMAGSSGTLGLERSGVALKIVLMPGMDGSGELLREFSAALPEAMGVQTIRYPADTWLPYRQLAESLLRVMPKEPFVLLAESYSSPAAVRIAAKRPEYLRGLVLCEGFCTSPLRGWKRWVVMKTAPLLGHTPMPDWAVSWLLLGRDAPAELMEAVKAAVSWVEPRVLAERLRATLRCNVLADLQRVEVPVLYVQATQGRLVNRACVEEIRRVKPGQTVAIDGPHLLLQREPELAAEVVMGFCGQVERAN
jgi:pimeloyl-[acyl-carrier protein] methyl ester esterase